MDKRQRRAGPPGLRTDIARFREGSAWKSTSHILVSLAAVVIGIGVALVLSKRSYLLGLGMAVVTAPFLVRLFIMQHDLGHGSSYRTRWLNDAVGSLLGIATITPYYRWRRTHAAHHATSGNLDGRRLDRDIFTLTVREYFEASRMTRFAYRCFRHPLVMFGALPLFVFLIEQRFAYGPEVRWKERASVWFTNAGLAILGVAIHFTVGLGNYLGIFLPMVAVAAVLGIWLFYVQHQFPDAYWKKPPVWTFADASILGSSFLDLPAPLRWLTGSIGLHHVHHLDPNIPHYRLLEAHLSNPGFRAAPRLTLWQALRMGTVDLWDEESSRMVRFGELQGDNQPEVVA